jgi:HECT-domain (ubiquitin-transferase)
VATSEQESAILGPNPGEFYDEDSTPSGQTYTEDDFYANVDERFVILQSDGTEKELCIGGRHKKVTMENLEEFINLMIKARLSEFDTQMKSIKEGIRMILPDNILFFMSW